MITSFGLRLTEDPFHGRSSSRLRRIGPDIQKIALRKLDMINAAREIGDLRAPPGNRLELLRGDLEGFQSVRVNDQWRIIFRWNAGEATKVELIDYH